MTWEQRWHPLREEWVVVSAHRQTRPWSGEMVASMEPTPAYDPACHLCPGNARISGIRNPVYDGIFTFDNDHPCVGRDAPRDLERTNGIYRSERAEGIARIVCYHPRHDVTMAELTQVQVRAVLEEWRHQYEALGARPEINHVLTFENKGEAVGVSNPHPHCQIYATTFVFKTIENEARVSQAYRHEHGHTLCEAIIAAEEEDGRRIVAAHGSALAFVPYFARLPYETFVVPRRPRASLAELEDDEIDDLAATLRELLVRCDNLWRISFPYVLVLHQAPTDGARHEGFHVHIEVHAMMRTPLLRKFLAGPELGGGSFLNDASPEEKAAELRAVSDRHYKASP